MGYTPPDSGHTLKVRVDARFRAELKDCVRLWKLHAKARGENPDAIDMSHFVRSTLQQGMDREFAEYRGGRPLTDEAWCVVEKVIEGTVAKKRSATTSGRRHARSP